MTNTIITERPTKVNSSFPSNIDRRHWQEWAEGSGIDPEIIETNLVSLDGDAMARGLNWTSNNNFPRSRGWVCYTRNIEGDRMEWGVYKPDDPMTFQTSSGAPKYRNPGNQELPPLILDVPDSILGRIAEKNGMAKPRTFKEVIQNTDKLVITEGCKKVGAALTAGIPTIGCQGTFTLTEKQDKTQLRAGYKEILGLLKPDATVIIAFDADSRKAWRNTSTAILRAATSIRKFRKDIKVRIAFWDGRELGKGLDDVLVSHGADKLWELIENAEYVDYWRHQNMTKLATPDVVICQRYLSKENIYTSNFKKDIFGDIVGNPKVWEGYNLIGICSPKGTGKTHGIIRETVKARNLEGYPPVLVGARTNLLAANALQLGITDLTEGYYQGELGAVFCVDSADKVRIGNIEEGTTANSLGKYDLHFDEANSVLLHLMTSKTEVHKKRAKIIIDLQLLILTCLERGGKVFLYDADLREQTVDFFISIVNGYKAEKGNGEKLVNPYIIRNDWRPEVNPSAYLYKKPEMLMAAIIAAAENGERLMIHTTGEADSSTWGANNIARRMGEIVGEDNVLVITGTTTKLKNHQAFNCTRDINQTIETLQPQIVIATSAIESGVSIDITDYFDGVYCMFTGLHNPDQCRQMTGRVRDMDVPRHLYFPEKGLPQKGKHSRSIDPQIVLNATRKNAKDVNNFLIDQVTKIGNDADHTIEDITGTPLGRGVCDKLAAEYLAEKNFINLHYKELLLEGLSEKDNYTVTGCFSQGSEQAKDEQKDLKKEAFKKYCNAVANAPKVSDEEWEEFKAKKVRQNIAEVYQVKHGIIERKYGRVEVTANLVYLDSKGFFGKFKNHYNLTTGREFVLVKDIANKAKTLQNNDGYDYIFDAESNELKVKAWELIGIKRILEMETLSNAHPECIEFQESVKKHRGELLKAFGTFPMCITPMGTIAKILRDVFGLELPEIKRGIIKTDDGKTKRVKIYGTPAPSFKRYEHKTKKRIELKTVIVNEKAIAMDDGRAAIFEAWKKHDLEVQATNAENRRNREMAIAIEKHSMEEAEAMADIDSHSETETRSDESATPDSFWIADAEMPEMPDDELACRDDYLMATDEKATDKIATAEMATHHTVEAITEDTPIQHRTPPNSLTKLVAQCRNFWLSDPKIDGHHYALDVTDDDGQYIVKYTAKEAWQSESSNNTQQVKAANLKDLANLIYDFARDISLPFIQGYTGERWETVQIT
ncbi:plasmid replication protein, CyRepA1 family [Limnospira platensis]|uniref:plasmid replication protein, CyRepA1 family n=1 Tax=Limnospira platensis TaxID=118562 RepID=UPI003D6EE64A